MLSKPHGVLTAAAARPADNGSRRQAGNRDTPLVPLLVERLDREEERETTCTPLAPAPPPSLSFSSGPSGSAAK